MLSPFGQWVLLFIIEVLPLFVIALRSNHPMSWLAFIPVVNLWLACDMADLGLAWVLLCFIPLFGAVLFDILVWWRLSENTNKPGWLGLFMWIPFVNLLVGYFIAFVDTGGLVA